ncbi:DUF115 domain-containing protein, partial [Campylobacter coli]|nr:DUF115 domain-containing protein [Campylobacter coli]
ISMQKNYVASIIFNLKVKDIYKKKNLFYIVNYLLNQYGDMFEIIIVEQGVIPIIKEDVKNNYKEKNIKYFFLYNPYEFDSGWGKNISAQYFSNTDTIVFYDFDFIVGDNFVDEIYLCKKGRYKVISPFSDICHLDQIELDEIKINPNFIKSIARDYHPIKSIAYGLCIFNKEFFLNTKGFVCHASYDIENRVMDNMLRYFCKADEIRISNSTYFCLWGPEEREVQHSSNLIFLKEKYGNSYIENQQKYNNICLAGEINIEAIERYNNLRKIFFEDMELYNSNDVYYVDNLYISARNNENFYTKKSEYEDSVYNISFDDLYNLNNFRNIYKGKRCFIIGNGPTLNKHDLSLLKNEITFGFNSIFYKRDEFKPNFYIVEDNLVMRENIEIIESYDVQYKFFPINYKSWIKKPSSNQIFFKMNLGFYHDKSRYYRIPRFSLDATEELFCGQSVTYIALQLAYFMGFSEVYFIGMDFHYVIPKSHKRRGYTLISDTDDPNHFHKDYFGKGKSWHDPLIHFVPRNYQLAKLIYESSGRKIYNATIGGKLEIFDRVDYYSIFKKSNIPNTGAVEQVKKHLSYKLGKAIIHDTKQFKNIINFPFRIFRIVKEHNKDKNNIGKNLREYSDYSEAVKIQQYFSYRLGKCIVSNYKNPFLLYKLIKIVIEHKRRK